MRITVNKKLFALIFALWILSFIFLRFIYSPSETTIVKRNIYNYVNNNYAMLEAFDYSSDTSSLASEIQEYVRKGIKKPDEIIVKIYNDSDSVYFSCGESDKLSLNGIYWSFIYVLDEDQYINELFSKEYTFTPPNHYELDEDRYTHYEKKRIRKSFFYCYYLNKW